MAEGQESLFAQLGGELAQVTATTDRRPHPLAKGRNPREEFLTGMLAQWAADDRQRGATPGAEEKRRARKGAQAALDQIIR